MASQLRRDAVVAGHHSKGQQTRPVPWRVPWREDSLPADRGSRSRQTTGRRGCFPGSLSAAHIPRRPAPPASRRPRHLLSRQTVIRPSTSAREARLATQWGRPPLSRVSHNAHPAGLSHLPCRASSSAAAAATAAAAARCGTESVVTARRRWPQIRARVAGAGRGGGYESNAHQSLAPAGCSAGPARTSKTEGLAPGDDPQGRMSFK